MLSPFVSSIIRVCVIITVTDLVMFYYLMKHPEKLTWRFAPLVIVVTIVPIVVNLWYVLVYMA
ncbi:MAG TPA: hypothetical protein VFU58_05490 [Candidatus Nitrosotalea sp.]|nr:hypothetical protein [Candidatus Nitrosotalea sp.]